MDRNEIVNKYTDEIMQLVKLKIANNDTVSAALQCVLAEWSAAIGEALAKLEKGKE